jgi:TctA family transporter
VIAGIVFGAIPGLSGIMAMALILPMTLFMDSAVALILMVALYAGAGGGGSIPASVIGGAAAGRWASPSWRPWLAAWPGGVCWRC